MFHEQNFDLIVHPVSNIFVPDVRQVWLEAFRVLRPDGRLLSGFSNPVTYLFDYTLTGETGILRVKYALPYSDEQSLPEGERQQTIDDGVLFKFSHTLET